jgi:transcription termination factor Rho
MSVLQRNELEESPLADLHAIASELGLEGFRTMRKPDLIEAILDAQGGEGGAAEEGAFVEATEPDEVTADEALEAAAGEVASAGTAPSGGAAALAAEAEVGGAGAAEVEPAGVEAVDARGAETAEAPPADESAEGEPAGEEEPEVVEEEVSDEQIVTGVLDILANGSGFIRIDPGGQSRDDVYVSPSQIRRCELRAGDEISGPVRPPRRNERHPSLVRVETVNGGDAEPPEHRPWFSDLTPVFPTSKLPAPKPFKDAPYGRGSRVAIAGPPGAGATALLRDIATELSNHSDLALQVILVGVRPEEVTDWRTVEGLEVAGGSFDRSPDAQAQAAELAVERAKRKVERGGHAAVLLDSLDALPAGVRRRLFGAARATEEGGTLTVVATTGQADEALRWATTRVVLEPGGKPVSQRSGTLRAERLS